MEHRAIVPICLKLYTLIKLRLSGGVLHLLHLRGGLHGGDDTQHPPLRTGHGIDSHQLFKYFINVGTSIV